MYLYIICKHTLLKIEKKKSFQVINLFHKLKRFSTHHTVSSFLSFFPGCRSITSNRWNRCYRIFLYIPFFKHTPVLKCLKGIFQSAWNFSIYVIYIHWRFYRNVPFLHRAKICNDCLILYNRQNIDFSLCKYTMDINEFWKISFTFRFS